MNEELVGSRETNRRVPQRRTRLILSWTVLVVALAIGSYMWRARLPIAAPPSPPELDLKDYDPQVAALIERAKEAVKASPRWGKAWGTLGAALMTHKLHREALMCFAEAEKLEPGEVRWPYLQGVTLLSWEPDAALPKLTRAAELTGEAPPAPRLRLVDALIERGELERAEVQLNRVLKSHPEEPHALLGSGKLALALKQPEAALAALKRCADHPQTARAAAALIAAIEQRLGHKKEAAEASGRLATLPPDAPMPDPYLAETALLQTGMQAWLTQADRLLKTGRMAEALALNEKTVSSYPEASIAWQMLGQARLSAKDYAKAEQALLRAVQLAPDSAESRFQLGSAQFLAGRVGEATDQFRRSISLRPEYAPGYFNLGLCLASAGERGQAVDAFRTAVQLDPGFADAHRHLGAMLALDQKFAEAIPPLTRALELNPADSAAAQMLERARLRAREQQ